MSCRINKGGRIRLKSKRTYLPFKGFVEFESRLTVGLLAQPGEKVGVPVDSLPGCCVVAGIHGSAGLCLA